MNSAVSRLTLIGDCISVLLGCDWPVLLRPTHSGEFLVVGQCFTHGLMDAEGILGPLLDPWKIEMLPGSDGRQVTCFRSHETQRVTIQDPRLMRLPAKWEPVRRRRLQDDPYFFRDFRDKETGFVVNADPRLSPMALEARGVYC